MRFLLDENVDARLGAYLRVAGHDVLLVVTRPGAGATDDDVLALARADDRILITNDADFGELVFRRQSRHAGVVLLRLRTTGLEAKQAAIDRVLRDYADRLGEFLVVTDHAVRIRRMRR